MSFGWSIELSGPFRLPQALPAHLARLHPGRGLKVRDRSQVVLPPHLQQNGSTTCSADGSSAPSSGPVAPQSHCHPASTYIVSAKPGQRVKVGTVCSMCLGVAGQRLRLVAQPRCREGTYGKCFVCSTAWCHTCPLAMVMVRAALLTWRAVLQGGRALPNRGAPW